jgi:hypothetical protein
MQANFGMLKSLQLHQGIRIGTTPVDAYEPPLAQRVEPLRHWRQQRRRSAESHVCNGDVEGGEGP